MHVFCSLKRQALISTLVLMGSAAKAQGLEIIKMTPVLRQVACVDSMIATPKTGQGCMKFTRQETAGPVYDELRELIYVGGSDGLLHVISAKTGETQKEIELPGKLITQPTLKNDRLFFGTQNGIVLAYRLSDLTLVWQREVDGEVVAPLVVDNDLVFAVMGTSTINVFEADSGKLKWEKKRPAPQQIVLAPVSKPLVYDLGSRATTPKMLVVGHPSGKVGFYEADTGDVVAEVMVADTKKVTPDVVSDPIYLGDEVVVASFNRGVVFLDSWTGLLRGVTLEEGITRLAYADGMVFAAGAKKVIGIDEASRSVRWRFSFQEGAPTRILPREGAIYVGSDRGPIFVLDGKTGRPLQYLGSALGFAADFDYSFDKFFAVSSTGYLFLAWFATTPRTTEDGFVWPR